MLYWIFAAVLIVGGLFGAVFGFSAAIGADVQERAWGGYVLGGGIGSVAIGVVLVIYLVGRSTVHWLAEN